MNTKTWRDRLIDPRSPDRRPRRAAYALPTLFTAGNVYLGFYALLETFQGSMDMVTVDLTPVPDARIGTPVVLWGEGMPVDDVATAAGTVGYELLCALAPRVPASESP